MKYFLSAILIFFFISSSQAHNKVVVVPLGQSTATTENESVVFIRKLVRCNVDVLAQFTETSIEAYFVFENRSNKAVHFSSILMTFILDNGTTFIGGSGRGAIISEPFDNAVYPNFTSLPATIMPGAKFGIFSVRPVAPELESACRNLSFSASLELNMTMGTETVNID